MKFTYCLTAIPIKSCEMFAGLVAFQIEMPRQK